MKSCHFVALVLKCRKRIFENVGKLNLKLEMRILPNLLGLWNFRLILSKDVTIIIKNNRKKYLIKKLWRFKNLKNLKNLSYMHQKANFVFLERIYDKNVQILLKALYCAESKLNITIKINRRQKQTFK